MTVILGRVDPTGTSCHGLCDVCQSTAALAGGTQRAALSAWLYKTHGNGIFTRCPSKVVVVAKGTGGWQKRQNKRDRTPHPPHLPPKAVRGDMGHGSAAGRGPTADAQGDLATVPRALQVPGQGRQPVRELPHPWYPRSLGTHGHHDTPDSPGTPGHHGTPSSPGTPSHSGTPRLTSGAGGPSGCGSW